MTFLLRVGQFIAASREPKDFWQQLLKGLDVSHLDLPFALSYPAGGDINETLSVSSEHGVTMRNWVLEGSVRSLNLAQVVDDGSAQTIPWTFYQISLELVRADTPTLLTAEDGSLPAFISRDIPVLDGEGSCTAAVFLPTRSTGDNVLGFLILGINPRKRYDDDYRLFIQLLSRQLASAMAVDIPLLNRQKLLLILLTVCFLYLKKKFDVAK